MGEFSEVRSLDAEELRPILAEAGINPDKIYTVYPEADSAGIIVFRTTNPDFYAQWTDLRGLVPATGRWPLAAVADILDKPGQSGRVSLDGLVRESVEAVLESATAMDVWDVLLGEPYDSVYVPNGMDPFEVVLGMVHASPLLEEMVVQAKKELSSTARVFEIENWLAKQQLMAAQPVNPETSHWVSEQRFLDVAYEFALVPTTSPTDGLAYLGHFYPDFPDIRVALMRDLNDRLGLGVEFVGSDWLHDLFVVRNPPTDPDDIWDISRAIYNLWPGTEGGGEGGGHQLLFCQKLRYLTNWCLRKAT